VSSGEREGGRGGECAVLIYSDLTAINLLCFFLSMCLSPSLPPSLSLSLSPLRLDDVLTFLTALRLASIATDLLVTMTVGPVSATAEQSEEL
jgi:hypothetical protein